VLFYIPCGLLIVMPRVTVMTDAEFIGFNYNAFVDTDDYRVPAEEKANSFGYFNGRIVAIDYGN
jgi:hypothetical protein